MEHIRNIVGILCSTVLAYFAPVQNIFLGVAWVFFLNFFFGLINGVLIHNENFQLKKAFRCFTEAAVLYLLMATIFFVGERIGNKAGALQCITGIVYALIYFYSVNILRNIKGIFPNNPVIHFLYLLLSIEIVKDIPIIGAYLHKFNDNDNNNDNQKPKL